ncbi:sugar ABC transporter ATP-binding protein [Rhodococcus fascians]|nr:sugar ABC transporter ATP-binding protein [Rhodococcus fascians]MBY4116487.1 sugar ABC transporter ATP-binding protein [Rhodococcus fascians]
MTTTEQLPRLAMKNVSKHFGRVPVLREVNLEVLPGEIHGLVGQNGSGKSTLIKLLSGFYPADAGASIEVDGRPMEMPISPKELRDRGVAFVHQDLGLDLDANVIENVRVGQFVVHPVTRRIRWQSEAAEVTRVLGTLGADSVDPFAPTGSLTHTERASVAIARALQNIEPGTGLVVFDESTQSLPRDILHEFYARVRAIAESGTSVLIVSHRLDEVLALCDRVTVLEDGRATIEGRSTQSLSEADLTRLILGSSASEQAGPVSFHATGAARDEIVMTAEGLAGVGLDTVSLTLRAGEVVGVIGTADSGYDVLPYVLTGAARATGGVVTVQGQRLDATALTPTRAIAVGLFLVPGDRAGAGLATDRSAVENLCLPRVSRRGGLVSPLRQGWQLDEFLRAVVSLGVTPAAPHLPVGAFSGGNQQKVLLAKWLLAEPAVLVLHEPAQAVDVGARHDILREVRRQADTGVSVLISSLETSDLASVCDRILVMKEGRVVRELSGAERESHIIIDAVYAGVSGEIAHV